jgi:hypothetical protein
MKKTVAAGLGCAIVAVLLVLKTCGKSGADDAPEKAPLATKADRAPIAPSSPPSPVERTSSGKYETHWTSPKTGNELKVRKILEMRATPAVQMVSGEAVGTVAVKVTENAEVWRPETKAWEKMTPDEYREWRGGEADTHKATATLVKSLDPQTKRPVVVRREAVGDGNEQIQATYNDTENNINITLEWQGDKLRVKWASSNVEGKAEDVAIPFDRHYLD